MSFDNSVAFSSSTFDLSSYNLSATNFSFNNLNSSVFNLQSTAFSFQDSITYRAASDLASPQFIKPIELSTNFTFSVPDSRNLNLQSSSFGLNYPVPNSGTLVASAIPGSDWLTQKAAEGLVILGTGIFGTFTFLWYSLSDSTNKSLDAWNQLRNPSSFGYSSLNETFPLPSDFARNSISLNDPIGIQNTGDNTYKDPNLFDPNAAGGFDLEAGRNLYINNTGGTIPESVDPRDSLFTTPLDLPPRFQRLFNQPEIFPRHSGAGVVTNVFDIELSN